MDWEVRFELEDDEWTCIIGLQDHTVKDCGKTIEKALQNTMMQLSQQGLDSFMNWLKKNRFPQVIFGINRCWFPVKPCPPAPMPKTCSNG